MKILILFDLHRAPKVDEEFSPATLRKEEGKPTEADVLECLRAPRATRPRRWRCSTTSSPSSRS